MKVIETKEEIQEEIQLLLKNHKSVGFVPTMGALHRGHLELVERSLAENDVSVCSIFVNPLQFNKKEDLDKYPNRLEDDLKFLEDLGCDFVFTPVASEFYEGVEGTTFEFGILEEVMEATNRPGHFEGVAAVVHELFNCIKPTIAYFGEKDYQQLAIVKHVVKAEQLSVVIECCATVRAESGLALSSRNLRLSEEGIETASYIFKALTFCKENKHIFDPETLAENAYTMLNENFDVEYFEIVDENSFEIIGDWEETTSPRAFVAANLEGVRLIDNMSLNH
jgi:pantoate--beta-alanine ligase